MIASRGIFALHFFVLVLCGPDAVRANHLRWPSREANETGDVTSSHKFTDQDGSLNEEDEVFWGRFLDKGSLPMSMPPSPPQSGIFVWVTGEGGTLVKMTSDGAEELFRRVFSQGQSVGVDPSDGSAWVPDIEGPSRNQAVKVSADGRDVLRVDNLRFAFLDVDPEDGSVWIGLPNENAMVKLNSKGDVLFRVPGFEAPWSIAVDPNDGSVWVADGPGQKLVKLGNMGDVILSVPVPGGFFSNTPQQISIDPRDSSVWYTNRGDATVVKLSSTGNSIATATGVDKPVAVSVDPQDGSIWTVSFSAKELIKFDATATELKRLKFDIVPLSVSVHPNNGTLWVGYSNNVLVQFSSEGEERTRFQLTDEETTTVNHIVTKQVGF